MARFEPVIDVIESLCLRSGDILMRDKGLYLDCANEVWDDMNEDVLKISTRVKIPVRRIFFVDKKTNSIDIPKFLRLCSVSAVDGFGTFYPLYRNDKIPVDIVDLGAAHDCACEFNCNSRLCNTIKGYEAVQSVKGDFMPDNTPVSFNCVDKKAVDSQGFLYTQTQYPLRVYHSGVWADTVLHTEETKICQVDIDANGCVCDTEANLNILCDACGFTPACISNTVGTDGQVILGGSSVAPPCNNPTATQWTFQCASKMDWFNVQCGSFHWDCRGNNIYNISELGNRIVFPFNFGWDKVMVRFYEDIDLKNLMIPYLAKNCFMTGLQFYATTHNDKKQQLSAVYEQKFTRQKWGLFLELNKYTIAELAQIFTPKVFVPSYIDHRFHNRNDWW